MINNIQARQTFTARLRGGNTDPSFGWVYREPGMPTIEDCRAELGRLCNEFGNRAGGDALSRFGVTRLSDLWFGSYKLFCEFAEACFAYDTPPSASWSGGNYGDPFVPYSEVEL